MFDLVDNKVVIPPSSLTIPEMKEIWKRDKSKKKEIAFQELSYVYHMSDMKSEYANYPEYQRSEKVRHEQINIEKWAPDELINKAVEKYREMKLTPTMRFLQSQERLLERLRVAIDDKEEEDFEDEKTMDKILSNSEKAIKLILQLPKLKKQVAKEESEAEHIRGGGEAGLFEE